VYIANKACFAGGFQVEISAIYRCGIKSLNKFDML